MEPRVHGLLSGLGVFDPAVAIEPLGAEGVRAMEVAEPLHKAYLGLVVPLPVVGWVEFSHHQFQ